MMDTPRNRFSGPGDLSGDAPSHEERAVKRHPLLTGLGRGLRRRCPQCGQGHLFTRYVTVKPKCSGCGLELEIYRSDDAPPYFTIFIVGHIIIPCLLLMEQLLHPPGWVHMAIWIPLTLLLTLLLLPPIKGAVIGAQWAFKIRG